MKEFTKRFDIARTKFTKNDLSELITIISDFSAVRQIKDLKISAQLPNLDISEYDLETFLNHSDLPDILDNIDIAWYNVSELKIEKSIFLRLSTYSSTLTVSGQDQTWVLGKYTHLRDYIISKRPALWFISTPFSRGIQGSIISLLFLIIPSGLYLIYSHLNVINSLIILAILPLLLLYFSLGKIKNTKIVLQEKESLLNKYGTIISITLSFLSFLVAVIAVIIGFISISR